MIFLAAFAWWEILIFTACVIGFCAAVIIEADGFAGILFVATLALCQWLFKIDVWSWFKSHYLELLLFFIGYLIVGTGWYVFKWFRYVKEELTRCRKFKNDFLKSKKVEGNLIPKELLKEWEKELDGVDWPPSPSKHRDDLIRWIIVWPVDVLWAILEDFFVWVGEKLYSLIGKLYKSISDKMFEDMRKDLGG
jgi:hypothetical protein